MYIPTWCIHEGGVSLEIHEAECYDSSSRSPLLKIPCQNALMCVYMYTSHLHRILNILNIHHSFWHWRNLNLRLFMKIHCTCTCIHIHVQRWIWDFASCNIHISNSFSNLCLYFIPVNMCNDYKGCFFHACFVIEMNGSCYSILPLRLHSFFSLLALFIGGSEQLP